MDIYTTIENIEKYDLALDIHITSRPTTNQNYDQHKFCNIELMNEAQFLKLLSTLNVEQRAIYDVIMYWKEVHANDPIHLFLTSGARTSKTFTLQLHCLRISTLL